MHKKDYFQTTNVISRKRLQSIEETLSVSSSFIKLCVKTAAQKALFFYGKELLNLTEHS